jgi:RNA polymerase primary sigma factor
MIADNMPKSDIFWHRLLNCSDARVLSSVEERKLLVELVDCKHRILEALHRADDATWDEPVATTKFQQLIRDLAGPNEASLHRTAEAVRRLALRYHEIRSVLAMANVRLVAHVAKRYYDRRIPPGDLVQEGFCALLVAIDRFDVANQTRLATYAVWWIRQAIQRAVASGAYPVRLTPRHLHRLAQARGMTGGPDRNPKARSDAPSPAFSPTIEHVFAATRPVLSLDAPSRGRDSTSIGEFLVPANDDDDAQYDDEDDGRSVADLIKTLGPREQLVLKLRFGLGGESPRTLTQVSHVFGVSKERVRQIEARALAVLRTLSAGDELPSGPRQDRGQVDQHCGAKRDNDEPGGSSSV